MACLNFFSGGTLTDCHNYCVQSVDLKMYKGWFCIEEQSTSRHKRISPTTKPTIIIVLLFSNYVIRNQNLTQVTVSKPRASLDLTGNKYNGETKRTTFRQKTVR